MSIDLKPYYDSALMSGQEVDRIMAEMDAEFNDGTEEGKEKALSLRADLAAAKKRAADANALYASLRDAVQVSDSVARNFVPAGAGEAAEDGARVMPRAEFAKLSPADQMAFVKKGGMLTDE